MEIHTHFIEQAFNKPYPSMECKYTTTKETEQIVQSLKAKNSYGYDEISTDPKNKRPFHKFSNKLHM